MRKRYVILLSLILLLVTVEGMVHFMPNSSLSSQLFSKNINGLTQNAELLSTDTISSANAVDTKDALSLNGVTGMRIVKVDLTIDGVKTEINKTDVSTNDFNVTSSFSRSGLQYRSASDGVKVEMTYTNTKDVTQTLEDSITTEIDYDIIMYNGTEYNLKKDYNTLHRLILRAWNETIINEKDGKPKVTDRIIAPNIFMDLYGTACNGKPCYKKKNFQVEANIGGYVEAWFENGKGYLELKTPEKIVQPRTSISIDPTYYNQTDGFSTTNCASPYGITNNGTAFFVVIRASPYSACIYNNSGTYKSRINSLDYFPEGVTTNGSSIYVAMNYNNANYRNISEFNFAGTKIKSFQLFDNSTSLQGIQILPASVTTGGQPTGFYVTKEGNNIVYQVNTTGGNLTGGFLAPVNLKGITSNNSDIWGCNGASNITHYDSLGNLIDSFDISNRGIGACFGIFTNSTNGGSPTNFWITDTTDSFVYDLGVIDTNPPIINIVYPDSDYTYLSSPNLNFTITEDGTIDTCWYSNTSGVVNYTLTNCANITGVTWDTSNNVTIYANDSFGNNAVPKTVFFYVNSSGLNTEVLGCGVILNSGIYNLRKSISSQGTCLNVSNNNVTIIGNGYTINFSKSIAGYGVYNNNFNNTNITGIEIRDSFSSLNKRGISITNSFGSVIENNTVIIISSTNSQGIWTSNNNNNTVRNNIVSLLGTSTDTNCVCFTYGQISNNVCNITYAGGGAGWGGGDVPNILLMNNIFYLRYRVTGSSNIFNFTFINNTVIGNITEIAFSNGYDYYSNISYNQISSYNDIFPYMESTGMIVSNNKFTVYGNGKSCYKFRTAGSQYEVINTTFLNENCYLNGSNSYGIWFGTLSINNSFINMNITTTNNKSSCINTQTGSWVNNYSMIDSFLTSNSSFYELNISNTKSGFFNFTNVTRNGVDPINITWSSNSNGTLNMMWYFNVNVTDGAGDDLAEANVTIYDALGNYIFSGNTSSLGNISRRTLLSYKRNETGGTNYTYYYPYNITVTKDGYGTYRNESVNLTNNVFLTINMPSGDNEYPQFSDYKDNNNSIYKGGIATFSVNVSSTNGTVILRYNNTNYIASNYSEGGIMFNVSLIVTTNGTFQYNWSAYGNGSSHLANTTINFYYTVRDDTTLPNISIVFPLNNTNTSNININVNYSRTDNINIGTCWYTNDSGLSNYTLANCVNITGVSWNEGINNVTIYINDTYNNINASSIRFTTDTKLPYFTNFANKSIYTNQSLNYNMTAGDTGIGFANFSINWSNTFEITTDGNLTNISGLTAQLYEINVSIKDIVGNVNSSILRINVSDPIGLAPPSISIIFPNNNTNTTNTNLNVNYTASDDGALSNCWYSNDSFSINVSLTNCNTNITTVTWSEGTHNIRVYANDTNAIQSKATITFTIDTTPPTFSNLVNKTLTEGSSLSYDINAGDNWLALGTFSVNNWTAVFTMNKSTGIIVNSTNLEPYPYIYYVNVSVNDTLGNLRSGIFWVNITPASGGTPTGGVGNLVYCRYDKFGYFNKNLPIIIQQNCISNFR